MYYRNAQAAVVVYDITKAASLDKAKSWVKELQRQANPNIVIALAGNKLDLVTPATSSVSTNSTTEAEDEPDDATATPGESGQDTSPPSEDARQVPTEDAQTYATEAGLLFFEVSAKTGESIMEMFTEIAKKIPIEHILASGHGANNARTGTSPAQTQNNVNLNDRKAQSPCNC